MISTSSGGRLSGAGIFPGEVLQESFFFAGSSILGVARTPGAYDVWGPVQWSRLPHDIQNARTHTVSPDICNLVRHTHHLSNYTEDRTSPGGRTSGLVIDCSGGAKPLPLVFLSFKGEFEL